MAVNKKSYQKVQKYYSPGEIIFTENSDCDGIYIVNEGVVSVFKTIKDGNGTREIELTRVGKNGMFGEMALIDQNKRSASVRVIESAKVTVLTTEMFNDQLSKLPPWVLNVVQLLVTRLRVTNNKLRKLLIEANTAPPPDVQDTGILVVENDKPETVDEETPAEPDEEIAEEEVSEEEAPVEETPEKETPEEQTTEDDDKSGVKTRLFAEDNPLKDTVKKEKTKEPLSNETEKLLDGLDF